MSPQPRVLDLATTMGGKDQSLPAGLKEEEVPLGSDELLNELIATQQREADFESQLEKDIMQEEQQGTSSGPATDQAPVLVPVVSRDIKADVALPRRGKVLGRSRTSSLVGSNDDRLRDLAHPIPPVLTTDDAQEMAQRFTDKLQQCCMPLDTILK